MTNAELLAKIKAEIDRLYGEYKDKFHQCGDQYHLGLIDGLDMAERVLDSIKSEHLADARKTSPKDLEEASEKYGHNKHPMTTTGAEESQEDFIAGAKWQKEQDRLEIANIKAKLWQDGFDDCKKQMMKDAVEGTVHNFSSYMPHPTVLVDAKGFNQGDKVRIIIIKED